jgi:hypothetical protein
MKFHLVYVEDYSDEFIVFISMLTHQISTTNEFFS